MDKRFRKGKDHPNFKGGYPNCPVCNKQLSQRFYTYCIKHRPKGEKHPSWKGGLPKCLTCGKQLVHYFNKYCVHHAPKDFLQTKQFKKSVSKRMQGNQFRKGLIPGNWKGDKANYWSKHHWMINHFGQPKKCEHCGKDDLTGRQIHWANKDHTYQRIRDNWLRLCAKCHKIYDMQQELR